MAKVYPKKYSKEQVNAIEKLICNLDELDNKPRRLYSALRDVATAFVSSKTEEDKEGLASVINRIDQAEDTWYEQWNFENEFSGILRSIRKKKNDLTSSIAYQGFAKQQKTNAKYKNSTINEEEILSRWNIHSNAIEEMAEAAIKMVIYHIYPEIDDKYERF